MKLLFDQNISFRIIRKIEPNFGVVKQVRELGLEDKSDLEIWLFAKANDFSIVTFDADFFDLSVLNGHPPKIIWIRTGNTSTDALVDLLGKNKDSISAFLSLDEWRNVGCLELGK